MSDYQINFGARKGETIITGKNTAKSQQQLENCTDYKPIANSDWNPLHQLIFSY